MLALPDFIVMEYVPGKTLEALIRPGMGLSRGAQGIFRKILGI